MNTCPSCGTSNESEAAFCANCGASLKQTTASTMQPAMTAVTNKAQALNTQFLLFLKPFLQTIDNGSFFRKVFGILYVLIAVLNVLLPIYLLFKMIDAGLFKSEGKVVISMLIIWFVIALLGWFGFQLWWDRRQKVNQVTYSGAEFVATPVVAHFIQTIGEYYGIVTAVLGFVMGVVSLLFGNAYANNYEMDDVFYDLPYFYEAGWLMIFTGPVVGFLIIVFFRFIAETIKALSAIANNTGQR